MAVHRRCLQFFYEPAPAAYQPKCYVLWCRIREIGWVSLVEAPTGKLDYVFKKLFPA